MQRSISGIVLYSDGPAFSFRPPEADRLFRAGQARIAIECNTRCNNLDGIAVSRRYAAGLQADLHFPFTPDLSGDGNEVAGARAKRVVALPFFSIHGDGNIFQEIAAALLEFRGARSAHSINRALPFDL